MLNITKNRIEGKVDRSKYMSFKMLKDYRAARVFARMLIVNMIIVIIILFLPWTQVIQSQGELTTLQPEERPVHVYSTIPGRIEKWYVREGDTVKKGDTLMFLSEVKDDYFDPLLLARTEGQIKAKSQSVESYQEKANALDAQIAALERTRDLKLQQARNYVEQGRLKVASDSIDLQAAETNLTIAERRLTRMEQLYKDGLNSLKDLESRQLKVQETLAKKISAENKLLSSRNALINAQVELNSLENQYREKISKATSDKYATLSSMYNSQADVTKMENQYSNYQRRSGFYYITAPQDGFVVRAVRMGIGEMVKENEKLMSIMPEDPVLAVAMFVRPMDLPLISIGQHVRFMFDGWPTVVFSGWPNLSYGTFGGVVVAIDRIISENGRYRVLVAQDPDDVEWPKALRVGSGADALALLNDVPIWYELWRNFNGFPPDYYELRQARTTKKKKK